MFCWGILLTSGYFSVWIIKSDIDYSKYLGNGYQVPDNYGTIVANHSSLLDTVIIGYMYETKMVGKAAFKSIPLLGWAAELLGTIFVDWADPNSKHKTIEAIVKT